MSKALRIDRGRNGASPNHSEARWHLPSRGIRHRRWIRGNSSCLLFLSLTIPPSLRCVYIHISMVFHVFPFQVFKFQVFSLTMISPENQTVSLRKKFSSQLDIEIDNKNLQLSWMETEYNLSEMLKSVTFQFGYLFVYMNRKWKFITTLQMWKVVTRLIFVEMKWKCISTYVKTYIPFQFH